MDINQLVKITARAWSLPILALMHRGTAGRQATLLAATGAGRSAFTQSLSHLMKLQLIERNPGHGHPLRPEYRLTPTGIPAAAMADQIEGVVPPNNVLLQTAQNTLLRRAWTVPILALSAQPLQFTHIKVALPTITDRALSQSLKQLQRHDWLVRDVNADVHPPRALYHAAGQGLKISHAVALRNI